MNFIAAHAGGRLARLLFFVATALAFVMAVLPHPPRLPGDPSDKVQHIAAFATLGSLGVWAFPRAGALRILAGLSAFGAVIEFIQAIPALNRDSDPVDWVADTIAAGLFIAAFRLRRRR